MRRDERRKHERRRKQKETKRGEKKSYVSDSISLFQPALYPPVERERERDQRQDGEKRGQSTQRDRVIERRDRIGVEEQ